MPARENQGLQIGLIVLSILTVILLVALFLVFRSYQDAEARYQTTQTERQNAENSMRQAVAERQEIGKLLGAPEGASMEDVQKMADEHLKLYASDLPPERQNYAGVVDHLANVRTDLNKRLADELARFEKLTAEYQRLQRETAEKLAQANQTVSRLEDALRQEQAKFAQQSAEVNQSKEGLVAMIAKSEDAAKAAQDALAKAQAEFDRRIDQLARTNEILQDDLYRTRPDNFERADGAITRVSAGTGTAFINVGYADGLPRQATFSVYPRGSEHVANAPRKGSVEVLRIIGPHLTEVRITDEETRNPIVPGDQIYSPAWQTGRREHFALAGLIDIDGDGQSDLDRVRRVIEMNGGVIDAIVDEQGQSPPGLEPDKLSVNTRYIVVGEEPQAAGTDQQAAFEAYSTMIDNARRSGVKRLAVNELLDYMGYRSEERTLALNSEMKASDFAAPPRRVDPYGIRRLDRFRRSAAPNAGRIPLPPTEQPASRLPVDGAGDAGAAEQPQGEAPADAAGGAEEAADAPIDELSPFEGENSDVQEVPADAFPE